MKIDKESLKKFRIELQIALSKLEKKHGIKHNLGSIGFDKDGFSGKISFVNVKLGQTGMTAKEIQAEKDFKSYCFRYGMEEDDVGRYFVCQGSKYKLIGAAPRSTKYPLLAKHKATGKLFKFPIKEVKDNFIKNK